MARCWYGANRVAEPGVVRHVHEPRGPFEDPFPDQPGKSASIADRRGDRLAETRNRAGRSRSRSPPRPRQLVQEEEDRPEGCIPRTAPGWRLSTAENDAARSIWKTFCRISALRGSYQAPRRGSDPPFAAMGVEPPGKLRFPPLEEGGPRSPARRPPAHPRPSRRASTHRRRRACPLVPRGPLHDWSIRPGRWPPSPRERAAGPAGFAGPALPYRTRNRSAAIPGAAGAAAFAGNPSVSRFPAR